MHAVLLLASEVSKTPTPGWSCLRMIHCMSPAEEVKGNCQKIPVPRAAKIR